MYLELENSPRATSGVSALNLEKLGNLSVESLRSRCRSPAIDYLALLVNQELFKVPLEGVRLTDRRPKGLNTP